MVAGEKREEFRDYTAHWITRLLKKDKSIKRFDYVEFRSGYGEFSDRPVLVFAHVDTVIETKPISRSYLDHQLVLNLNQNVDDKIFIIRAGELVHSHKLEKFLSTIIHCDQVSTCNICTRLQIFSLSLR